MRQVIILFLLVAGVGGARAGIISGKITDSKGNPLPFANVYVIGTTNGTTANEVGVYRLLVTAGEYDLEFKFPGFRIRIEHITVTVAPQVMNITLEPADLQTEEIVEKGKKDPADAIIKKAIAARSKHFIALHNYHSDVYIKALQKIITIEKKLFGISIFHTQPDTTDPGIFYLSESVSDFTFQKPNDMKEIMRASKVSGKSEGFSSNRAGDFALMDFYDNEFYIPQLSDQPFITPLAFNAPTYYHYHLVGSFKEGGKKIYKIQCSPKGPIGPAFAGYIYLEDKSWALNYVDLMLTKKHSIIRYVDTLRMKYNYTLIDDSVSVPLSQSFYFNFGFLGQKAVGHVVAVYSDYQPNIKLPKNFFSNEVMTVGKECNGCAEDYWDVIRPIPLSEDEAADYESKDTIEKLMQNKHYLDSIDRKASTPNPVDFFVGYSYRNNYRGLTLHTIAPVLMTQYNTVEGWNLRLLLSLTKDLKHGKAVTISPSLRYGFSNHRFNGTTKVSYLYNAFVHGSVDVEGGRYAYQFNSGDPISELVNSFNTLFLNGNYMKLYEDRFVRFSHHIEPLNGLTIHTGLNFSHRYHLYNTSYQKAIKLKNREYTANDSIRYLNGALVSIPFFSDTTQHFDRLDATILSFSIVYQPGRHYITRPNGRTTLDSKWPELTINYSKGIPIVGNKQYQIDYDYVGAVIQQTLKLGIRGLSKYAFGAGWFPNHKAVGFMDYHHFNDNQTYFGQNYFTGYQLLSYHSASTDKYFFEGHFEHHFNGLLLNKLTRLSPLRWGLVFGAHVLYTPDYGPYGELSIGVENIFHAFRVDFVNGFGASERFDWGVKFGVNFNEF